MAKRSKYIKEKTRSTVGRERERNTDLNTTAEWVNNRRICIQSVGSSSNLLLYAAASDNLGLERDALLLQHCPNIISF